MQIFTISFSVSNSFSVNRPEYAFEVNNKDEVIQELKDLVDSFNLANSLLLDDNNEVNYYIKVNDMINQAQFTTINVNLMFEFNVSESQAVEFMNNPRILNKICSSVNRYIELANNSFRYKTNFRFKNKCFELYPITDEDIVTMFLKE